MKFSQKVISVSGSSSSLIVLQIKTVLFLSLSHCHPGAAAALRRPVQHLCLRVPAEGQLPHQRTQNARVSQQCQATDRNAEERKEKPPTN